MKIFKCGFCKKRERIAMVRSEFRTHLRLHVRNNLFNVASDRNASRKEKHGWVIEENR